ncbi:MAG: CsgG/HfaB family protein [Longimicrobiales bacterium]
MSIHTALRARAALILVLSLGGVGAFGSPVSVAPVAAQSGAAQSRAEAARSQAGADLPTAAVMDFNGFMLGQTGNSVPIGKAVTSMLVTELSEREGIRVVERARLQEILQEQRLALSGRVDEGTAIEVGRMLGVQYMIFGNVANVVDEVRLDMRAVNVETSEVLEVQKLTDDVDQLLSLVMRVADLFTARLELEPPSARPDVAEIPVQATIQFSRAVDLEDQGEIDRAVELYGQTLEIHPDHQGARLALERLRAQQQEGGNDGADGGNAAGGDDRTGGNGGVGGNGGGGR